MEYRGDYCTLHCFTPQRVCVRLSRNRSLSSLFLPWLRCFPFFFFFFFALVLFSLSLFLCLYTTFDIQHCIQPIDNSSSSLSHVSARIRILTSFIYLSFFRFYLLHACIFYITYNNTDHPCFSISLFYCLFFHRQILKSVIHRSTITTSTQKSYIKVCIACEKKCFTDRKFF
jgi:hypothetical protein